MSPYVRIHFKFDDQNKWTSAAISKEIAQEIESGRTPMGARLPPVRVIQHQLGVAKQTVARAYEELQQRGLVINKPRLGYYAAAIKPVRSSVTKNRSAPAIHTIQATFPPVVRTSQRVPPNDIFLGSVFVDKDLLPLAQIQKCFKSVLPIISQQSRPLPFGYKKFLETCLQADACVDQLVCPTYWGGYTVIPRHIEFWQGKLARRHHRMTYALSETGWQVAELYP